MKPKMWLINWFEKNSLATGINMKNSLKENYFENGWIDSLKFIELITQIEEKFGIRFSNDEFLDRKFSTIEGLTSNGKMHPMQEAFKKHHGLQCGFCTPGMVMSVVDLLQKNKSPSEKEIRDWLEGNICRCTGYQGIVAAVKHAASKM